MNAYIGCGPHRDADVLIMGNEEGTGGYPKEIDAHMVARFLLYGKSEEQVTNLVNQYRTLQGDFDQIPLDNNYAYHYGSSWKDGFWEPNGLGGENKIEALIKARTGSIPVKTDTFSPFLMQSARIVYGLTTDSSIPVEHWFRTGASDTSITVNTEIKEYARQRLFSTDSPGRLKTALLDWRPLPRSTQDTWPPLYGFLGEDDSAYLEAYNFGGAAQSELRTLVESRVKVLRSAIVNSRASILIMTGEVSANKLQLAQAMFPDSRFISLPMRNNKAYYAQVNLPNKRMHVYLLPFFNYLKVEELCTLVKNYIGPDFHGQARQIVEASAAVWIGESSKLPKQKKQKEKSTPSTSTHEWIYTLKDGDRLTMSERFPVESERGRGAVFVGLTSRNNVRVNVIDKRTGKRLSKVYSINPEWLVPPEQPL